MSTSSYDAIIIGAGAAGLAAASELARAGCCALVVESRRNIGGRVWSRREPGLPVPLELGAEFIHGHAPATFSLLARAGTAAIDTCGEHWTLRDGRLERTERVFREIQLAMKRTRGLQKTDLSFAAFLTRYLDHELSQDARHLARTLAEGYDAADLDRASARAIVEEWSGSLSLEAPQFRPLGGYGSLLSRLAAELSASKVSLQLATVVHAVRWQRRSVVVQGFFLGRPFQAVAPHAIVTLPLGVLQLPYKEPGAVRFTPALDRKRAALKGLAAGPVLKVLLRFKTAFWEELDQERYRDAAFFHASNASFPTFWTALPVRTPLLVAWAAGSKAQALAGAGAYLIITEAVKSLTTTFGRVNIERMLEGAWVHDWQADPYARGAYSYVAVGGDKARAALAAPLLGTLFFAGEATDTEGEASTVAGALQSGARAARELLAALSRKSESRATRS